MKLSTDRRIALLALVAFALDQASKWVILRWLADGEEWSVIQGFFNLVHVKNTGAAWSMFYNHNELLTIVGLVALLLLFLTRRRFYIQTRVGWIAMGLLFGGIAGNLTDRLYRGHVIDFLYFYIRRRVEGGGVTEIGYPAFNLADSAICVGVALLFILSFQKEKPEEAKEAAGAGGVNSGQPAIRG